MFEISLPRRNVPIGASFAFKGFRSAVSPVALGAYMSVPLVLIVEDEILVRLTAVFLLEEAGFGTLEAGSADEAIALLEARKDIQVVFTDINMPGSMDGLRLAHAIRHRWPPVQLVLTSGRLQIRDEDLPERGIFLGKPYAGAELIHAVRSLVE
jgi:CheY-like chemotaxis protein